MNIFKKYDRIHSPYSTIIALGGIVLLGLFLTFLLHGMWPVGIGFILGGFSSILLKAAAEVSDREMWQRVKKVFATKHDDEPD